MDDSSIFKLMLAKAVESEPLAFTNFDRTRNVQDQLQEMVGGNWVSTFEKFGWFANDNIVDEWSFDNTLGYGSMEQLWLAFVMKTLYSKKWDGEQWE